ncbi:hypothetical protein [Oceanobacillus neutriphilus]|uniref:Uncharacterized protein n=1 Tax=Oceanobacillus neutriphilus TaxID=531815 RepID=A0ABQ2NTE7_9BACI|nr:hypothetical protein [Oceanobacillus neutriphilus]GGP07338.1 hypothetical protein GCM10011346_02930 [Oceanobacillus neutriphilus]
MNGIQDCIEIEKDSSGFTLHIDGIGSVTCPSITDLRTEILKAFDNAIEQEIKEW